MVIKKLPTNYLGMLNIYLFHCKNVGTSDGLPMTKNSSVFPTYYRGTSKEKPEKCFPRKFFGNV